MSDDCDLFTKLNNIQDTIVRSIVENERQLEQLELTTAIIRSQIKKDSEILSSLKSFQNELLVNRSNNVRQIELMAKELRQNSMELVDKVRKNNKAKYIKFMDNLSPNIS